MSLLKLKDTKPEEKSGPMVKLLEDSQIPPQMGDLIDGEVIGIDINSVYVDLPPFGTGIIFGREFITARDLVKKLHPGDTVTAKVVETDNEEGYIELSLKEAKQALIWGEVEEIIEKKTPVEISVKDANKGGLILNWQGLQGFLPASQLSSENYPRVEDGDKEKIFTELKKMIGEKMIVTIIGATQDDGKLVFSEKGITGAKSSVAVEDYKVGDELDGEVTGMVDFGVFVKIADGLEGLVHISEIDWALVENPKSMFEIGDQVKVKVIEVKDGKVSLSIKALKENPWASAGKKYSKGDKVNGVIIKFNKHGALAAIEEGVAGLIHVSEFGSEEELRETIELGKTYDFKITLFDPENQKMTLTMKMEDEPISKEPAK